MRSCNKQMERWMSEGLVPRAESCVLGGTLHLAPVVESILWRRRLLLYWILVVVLLSICLLRNPTIVEAENREESSVSHNYVRFLHSFLFHWKISRLLRDHNPSRHFRQADYDSIWSSMRALAEKYPNLASLYKASEMLGLDFHDAPWFTCHKRERCEIPILLVTNKETLNPFTPEVFLSGALHGNERVGPVTLSELAVFLCTEFDRTPEITYMMNRRAIYIMPFPNAWGYSHNDREENKRDPNRDFPYQRSEKDCMTTFTAQSINELFRRHLFRVAITFHGGTRVLSYEWGSKDHATLIGEQEWTSKESPDNFAQKTLAEQLQKAAGKDTEGHWFYPMGTMTEEVYPVDGGMEDWSYSGSWQASPNPISQCKPANGYDPQRTVYDENVLRCSMFLIETDILKNPNDETYGWSKELWSPSNEDGHVPRNMRMSLKLAMLAEPDLLFHNILARHQKTDAEPVEISVYGVGCSRVGKLRVVITKGICPLKGSPHFNWYTKDRDELFANTASYADHWTKGDDIVNTLWHDVARESGKTLQDCRGLGMWEKNEDNEVEDSNRGKISFNIIIPKMSGEYCAAVLAQFDQDWATQEKPDPKLPPQSHVARVRLEDYYAATPEGPSRIEGHKIWVFPSSLLPEYATLNGHTTKRTWLQLPISSLGMPFSVGNRPRSAHVVVHMIDGRGKIETFVLWFEDRRTGGSIELDLLRGTLKGKQQNLDSESIKNPEHDMPHVKKVMLFAQLLKRPLMKDEVNNQENATSYYYKLRIYKYGNKLEINNVPFMPPNSRLSDGVVHEFTISADVIKGPASEYPSLISSPSKADQQEMKSPSENLKVLFQSGTIVDFGFEQTLGRTIVIERYSQDPSGATHTKPVAKSQGVIGADQLSVFQYTYSDYVHDLLGEDTENKENDATNTISSKVGENQAKDHKALASYWKSGVQLVCVVQNPTILHTNFNPTLTSGYVLFTFSNVGGVVTAPKKEKDLWGTVKISGQICRVNLKDKQDEVSVKALSNCCPTIHLRHDHESIWRPLASRVFIIDKSFSGKECHCGPGSRFRIQTNNDTTEYTCALGYSSNVAEDFAYSDHLCPSKTLPVPSFAHHFSFFQSLGLLIIVTAAFILLLLPCVIPIYELSRRRQYRQVAPVRPSLSSSCVYPPKCTDVSY